jgi:hypothetical protein
MSKSAPPAKETLIVVVGAGASIQAGLPSTSDLLDVTRNALPILTETGIKYEVDGKEVAAKRSVALAEILDEALRGAYGTYDFELLLHAIEELETIVSARETPALLPEYRPVLSALMDLSSRYERIADSNLLRFARLNVIRAIHSTVGDLSAHPKPRQPYVTEPLAARAQIHRMLATLSAKYRLVVIDLNYDDVVDAAPVDWQDGFNTDAAWSKHPYLPADMVGEEHCKLFRPDVWDGCESDSDSNLLIHLHGSILFGWPTIAGVQPFGRYAEPVKFGTPGEALESLDNYGYSGNVVGGQNFDGTPIISGLQKGGKMIYNARPYGYYYRSLMNLIPTANRLLVLGYGWRDVHLNTWIDEMLARQRERKVGVVTYLPGTDVGERTEQNGYLSRIARAAWSRLQSVAWAGREPSGSDFHHSEDFAICPSGFMLKSEDERRLLQFMTS